MKWGWKIIEENKSSSLAVIDILLENFIYLDKRNEKAITVGYYFHAQSEYL